MARVVPRLGRVAVVTIGVVPDSWRAGGPVHLALDCLWAEGDNDDFAEFLATVDSRAIPPIGRAAKMKEQKAIRIPTTPEARSQRASDTQESLQDPLEAWSIPAPQCVDLDGGFSEDDGANRLSGGPPAGDHVAKMAKKVQSAGKIIQAELGAGARDAFMAITKNPPPDGTVYSAWVSGSAKAALGGGLSIVAQIIGDEIKLWSVFEVGGGLFAQAEADFGAGTMAPLSSGTHAEFRIGGGGAFVAKFDADFVLTGVIDKERNEKSLTPSLSVGGPITDEVGINVGTDSSATAEFGAGWHAGVEALIVWTKLITTKKL